MAPELLFLHAACSLAVTLFIVSYDRGISIFSPMSWYLLFHNAIFVLRPIIAEANDFSFVYSYIGFYPLESDKQTALAATNVALISLAVGYYTFIGKYKDYSFNTQQPVTGVQLLGLDDVRRRAVYLSLAMLAPIAAYSAVSTIEGMSFDGTTRVQVEWVDGVLVNVNSSGYFVEFKNVFTSILVLALIATRFHKAVVAIVLIYVGYRLFLGWQRIFVVSLGLQIILYLCLNRQARWPSVKFIACGILILPFFSFVGENRDFLRNLLQQKAQVQAPSDRTLLEVAEGLDFASYEYLVFIVSAVPHRSQTYSYGTQYLQVFTEPIPRVVWEGKPAGQPVKLVELNDYGNFLGLTRSLVGDGWINGGYVGVAITLALCGAGLAYLYKRLFLYGNTWGRLSWLLLLPYSLQFFRDGGLVSILKFTLFALLPVIVAAALETHMKSKVANETKNRLLR